MAAAGFPGNTVLIIVLLMLATGVAAWLVLNQGIVRALEPRQRPVWQWSIGAVLGVWLALSLWLAASPPDGRIQFIPYSLVLIGLGSLLGVGTFVLSPTFRRIILTTPAHWLIGVQSLRLFGCLFVALFEMGRLPADFALPAGYGDMTAGLLALLASFALASGRSFARPLAIGANVFGLLDFVVALSTGLSALTPFGQQLAAAGISPLYIGYVLLVPTFAVPVLTLLHVFSLYQLSVQKGTFGSPLDDAVAAPREEVLLGGASS